MGIRLLFQGPHLFDQSFPGPELGVAPQDNVGPPAGHVGGDGNGALAAGLGDDLRFPGMVDGVEDLVGNALALQHLAEHLRLLHGDGPHQHRLPPIVAGLDLLHHRLEFGPFGLVNHVRQVPADHGAVGGDNHHVHAVNFSKLLFFRGRRPGHARQFLIHAEEILESDGSHRPGFILDGDAFLGFNGLVEAVGVAPPPHQAAGELVDNDHPAVLHHVFHVPFVEGISLQQLVDAVQVLAGDLLVNFFLLFPGARPGSLLKSQQAGQLGIAPDQLPVAFLGNGDPPGYLVDNKEQLFVQQGDALLRHQAMLGALHQPLHPRLPEQVEQPLVFRGPAPGQEEQLRRFFAPARLQVLLGLGQQLVDQARLLAQEVFHGSLPAGIILAGFHAAADDERGPGFVDEDAVHLVDNGIVQLPLHQLLFIEHHVVPQVVKAQFVVGGVDHVGGIGLPALLLGQAVDNQAHF